MKLLLICLLVIVINACNKPQQQTTNGPSDWFEIEIKETINTDCQLPSIGFETRRQEAYTILGDSRGTYIALGLPKVLYSVGTKLKVRFRKPTASEDIACTAFGPAWSHVLITEMQH
jgi:hypothetical protein